jgi:hypothetical protein
MVHSILFTGHMIDRENRKEARFPEEKHYAVGKEIQKLLIKEQETKKYNLKGIAGGACGGDILFHESCAELGIPTEIFLALPIKEFKKASVSFAGKEWDTRFDKLVLKLPLYILPDTDERNENKNVYERTNLWMLDNAIQNGGENMTLIALWDKKSGDGSGGTQHLVKIAKERGAETRIIDITKT